MHKIKWFYYSITWLTLPALLATNTIHAQAAVSTGSTYYVSVSGNDANSGTSDRPWKTINKANSSAPEGSIIIITAGTYPERVKVVKGLSFFAEGLVKMYGFSVSASNVTIRGFEITNSTNSSDGTGITVSGSYCLVENNYIHDTAREGILLKNTSEACTIRANRIYRAEMSGIEVQGRNNRIEGNDISATVQYGPLWPDAPSSADADGIRFFGSGHIIRANYIHDIPSGTVR